MYLVLCILIGLSALIALISLVVIIVHMFTETWSEPPMYGFVFGICICMLLLVINTGVLKHNGVDWENQNATYVIGFTIDSIYEIDGEYYTQKESPNPSFEDFCVNGPIITMERVDKQEVYDSLCKLTKPTGQQMVYLHKLAYELGILSQ